MEQTQGTTDLAQTLLTQVQVAGGGAEVGVAQQLLDDGDLGSAFQQQGGEAVTQRMNPELLLEPGAADRAVEDILRGSLADRVLIVSLGEDPADRPMHSIPPAQLDEQGLAHDRDALASALGMGDAQLEPGCIDVLDLEMSSLGEAQAAAEDGHEKDAAQGITGGADGDQALDLLGAIDAGWLGFARGTFDPGQERLEVLAEQTVVEGAQGVDGDIDGGGGELALGDEVE